MKKFYMIYVEGEKSPTKKHEKKEEAKLEAKRLASKTNKPVFILEAFSKIIKFPEFKEENLLGEEFYIPF